MESEENLETKETCKDVHRPVTGSRLMSRFSSIRESFHDELSSKIVGLLTLDEMKEKQKEISHEKEVKIISDTLYTEQPEDETKLHKIYAEKRTSSKSAKVNQAGPVSFDFDEEPWEAPPKKLGKNKDADISFLPDREKETRDKEEREIYIIEWLEMNRKIKSEIIKVSYLYWDGSGHKMTCEITKGSSMDHFLAKCLVDLKDEFLDLKTTTVDQFMVIKEDLIIPHYYTFYDFIIQAFKSKEGRLLFRFTKDPKSIHEIEYEEDAPMKICLRNWYEKNKHIFPVNKWTAFNPEISQQKHI